MLDAYLVGKGEFRKGMRLYKIAEMKTLKDLEILVDVYSTLRLIRSEELNKAFIRYKIWAIDNNIRTEANMCTPPTEEELREFDNSLVDTEKYGKETITKRSSNANYWMSFIRGFWDWIKYETMPEPMPEPKRKKSIFHRK